MKCKQFFNFICLISLPLFAITFEELPEVIDFSSFKGSVEDANYDEIAWKLGYASLNYAPEISGVFSILKRDYKIETVIETGTHRGASTQLFGILFENVHTIEILESSYNISKNFLKESPNVQCHLGSAEKVLGELLPQLVDRKILFYLDAHWESYWPLLDELEIISHTHRDNCIIVIDDFKVPGRSDIPYDHYEGHACSFEYIESQLKKVFTDYSFHYIIPKSISSRAKFIAIPKKWNEFNQK